MTKKILSVVLLVALFGVSLNVFGANGEENFVDLSMRHPQEYAELVALAKDAELFTLFAWGEPLEWMYVVNKVDSLETAGENAIFWNYTIQPFVEKGYIDEKLTVNPSFDYHTDHFLYFDLPDAMQTMQAWEEAVQEYFTGDHWGILRRIVKRNGRYVILADRGVGYNLEADWENAKLVEYNESRAVLTVDDIDGALSFAEMRDMTFVFVKTKDGWRIDESTYMVQRCGKGTPPQTGDPTSAYALIFTLAALPLAGFGVAEWKRRRRAV
ncbi:MAG: hypothetical protein J6M12_01475 [Clostridia bacterium]|nr:hypothetical protein [Clostridia bacterium]